MRVIFFGSGSFGLPTLDRLAAEHEVLAVVTQPDRPAGRKRKLTATPVGQWATERGLDAWKAQDVNTPEFVTRVAQLEPEASVVIAFGQKLSPTLIDAMGKLAVNLHASLLPKYRGAAPIQRAMLAGETRTGVSVIALAQKMDAGAVFATAATDIDPNETAGELHDRLARLGPEAIASVLDDLARGTLNPIEQDHDAATLAPKLTKAEGTVDFHQPAHAVRATVHGLTPWPGCRVGVIPADHAEPDPEPLSLCRVADVPGDPHQLEPGSITPDGHVVTASADAVLEVLELQRPGSRPMTLGEFVRGHGDVWRRGTRLTPWWTSS